MTRGDVVRMVAKGDYGKPRPAVIIQADIFSSIPSLTVLPLTSDLRNVPSVRIDVAPDASNGLLRHSQIMIDKITTVAIERIGQRIGSLSPVQIAAVDQALTVFLGLAGKPVQ